MSAEHDSRDDTLAHIHRVCELLARCRDNLIARSEVHDASKLEEPEKSAFDRLKALSLSGMAYGSAEYRACLRAEKPDIEHHYKANSHHPEFYDAREIAHELRAAALTLLGAGCPSDHPSVKAVIAAAEAQESSVGNMSLFDVLEMLMDWKAATERMKDGGDIHRSLEINTERFKISPQLASILANTIREMQWPKPTVK